MPNYISIGAEQEAEAMARKIAPLLKEPQWKKWAFVITTFSAVVAAIFSMLSYFK